MTELAKNPRVVFCGQLGDGQRVTRIVKDANNLTLEIEDGSDAMGNARWQTVSPQTFAYDLMRRFVELLLKQEEKQP